MKFQNCSLIFVRGAHTDGRTDKPKAICPLNFFKVGGITRQLTAWISHVNITPLLGSVTHYLFLKERLVTSIFKLEFKLEFRESDVSPGKTEVKQGKFFELISPGGRGCVKGQNVCLHGALCAIPINLICNITTFRKEMF